MKTLLPLISTSLSFLLVVSTVAAGDIEVKVAAGKHARSATPVSVDLELPGGARRVVVESPAGKSAGQLETLPSKKTRLWWIVEDLAAGAERVYRLKLLPEKATGPSFAWKDSSGDHGASLDLVLGDRRVLRYMHTPFDPADVEKTKKPFHHVFDPDGSQLITKGAGGLYSHHRGIYFGYNKCKVEGRGTFDVWHAHNGEHQAHRAVERTIEGPIVGGHVVRIHWKDRDGEPFVDEERRIVAFRQPDGMHLIEVSSTLKAVDRVVELDGDRQHAGLQFRAAQAVAENQKATRYVRPAAWSELDPAKQYNDAEHRDLPWNAIRYAIGDRSYTVAYLSDPANPGEAEFSERLYGRFGEFFRWRLSKETPLTVRYRFWIDTNGSATRERIESKYHDLAHPPTVRVVEP